MAKHYAVCQDTAFWDAADWTTYDGTVITNTTERDAYYESVHTSLEAATTAAPNNLIEGLTIEILGPWATPDGYASIAQSSDGFLYTAIATVGVARPGNVNNYKIEVATGNCADFSQSACIVDGIYFKNTGTENGATGDAYKEAPRFYNCIFEGAGGGQGISISRYGFDLYVENCLFFNWDIGVYGGISYFSTHAMIVNSTVYNCSNTGFHYGYWANADAITCINCVGINNGTDFTANNNSTKINCISSDSSAASGLLSYGNATGKTAADIFTNAPADDFTLHSTSFARGFGVKLTEGPFSSVPALGVTPEKDVVGNWRHTPPDCGAYEYDDNYIPGVPIKISGIVEGSVLAIYKTSDGSEVVAPTTIGATGIYTGDFSYTADTDITIYVRKSSSGTKYKPWKGLGTITSSGLNVVVSQVEDPVAI